MRTKTVSQRDHQGRISSKGKLQIPGNVHIRSGTGVPDSIGNGRCCNSLPNRLYGKSTTDKQLPGKKKSGKK